MSVDPLTNETPDMTPYHYTRNNPINRVDIGGLTDITITVKRSTETQKSTIGTYMILSKNLFVFFILLVFYCTGLSQNTEHHTDKEKILDLVNKFQNRDGAQFVELSYNLSKMLVLNDSVFFKVMFNNQDTFCSWIEGLQKGTFTVYCYEDNVDKVLKKAMFSKLKELMQMHNNKYIENPKYKYLSKKLRQRLKDISIKFID